MDSYFLNFLINLSLMAFAVFSVIELIYDKSIDGTFFHKIKKRGRYLIFFAMISIVFNFYKDYKSDIKQGKSDEEKAKVDSLLHASQLEIKNLQISTKNTILNKVESTFIKSIKASNEALAKYNLEVTDSMHSVVSTLKLNSINPQLSLIPLEKGKQSAFVVDVNGESRFKIQFLSKGGTSYNVKLDCYIIEEKSNGDHSIIKSYPLAFGEGFIIEDVTSTMEFILSPEILELSDVMIFISGSFSKDPLGKFIIPFNKTFIFNFKENHFLGGIDMKFNQLKKELNIK